MEKFDIERITSSLSALEDNLKEIVSAKQQVYQIESSSKKLIDSVGEYKNTLFSVANILKSISSDSKDAFSSLIKDFSEKNKSFANTIVSLTNYDFSESFEKYEKDAINAFESELTQKLAPIDTCVNTLNNSIISLIGENENLNQQITKLVDFDFTESMLSCEKQAIEKFELDLNEKMSLIYKSNENLQENIQSLSLECRTFSEQVKELENFNFTESMMSFEKKAIDQFVQDLEARLTPIQELDSKVNSDIANLSNEISRLKSINLEEHFNKHQNKLSEVFNSLNSINVLMTQQLQNSNMFVMQTNSQFKDLNDRVDKLGSEVTPLLENQKTQIQENKSVFQESVSNLNKGLESISSKISKIAQEQQQNRKLSLISISISVLVMILVIIVMLKK